MARPWTDDERALLDRLIADEQPLAVMVTQIGRSANSIRVHMRDMIFSREAPLPDRQWSAADIDEMRRMKAKGLCFVRIGVKLRRTPRHCQEKFFDLSTGKVPRAPVRNQVTSKVAAQRKSRIALQHASITAAVFGDPLPGRSALDQRSAR